MMLNLLMQFLYLQLLDVLTTLAFLVAGAREINPLIRLLAESAGTPLAGLIVAKAIAVALALFCWKSDRRKLLARVNVFYAALVAWNVVAFLVRANTLPA